MFCAFIHLDAFDGNDENSNFATITFALHDYDAFSVTADFGYVSPAIFDIFLAIQGSRFDKKLFKWIFPLAQHDFLLVLGTWDAFLPLVLIYLPFVFTGGIVNIRLLLNKLFVTLSNRCLGR
jgi:hypothetical protein